MHDIFIVRNSKNEDNCSYIKERFPHAVPIGPGNKKDLFAHVCNLGTTEHAWILDDRCDYSNFDFEYYPPWHQNSQMHVWPTENQDKGGDTVLLNRWEYLQQYNDLDYVQNYQAVAWKKIKIEEKESPEIFMWCRVPNLAKDFDDGITRMRYVGTELDMLKRTVRKASGRSFWVISDEVDYDEFDFSWRPSWEHDEYLHVWPTGNSDDGGDTMYVNVENFLSQIEIEHLSHYQTIQWHEKLKQKVRPQIVSWTRKEPVEGSDMSLRYIGTELDMMKRTLSKIDTQYFWIVSDNCDYTDFDFSWRPSWATQKHLHVWSNEHQKRGGDTMYVNTAEMKTQILALEALEHYNVINWKKDKVKQKLLPPIVSWTRNEPVEGSDISLRYIGTELDMMKRTLSKIDTPYFWIVSDDCDYTEFNFSWCPGWSKQKYLHVWPTENQIKGGDTMYVNTAQMQTQLIEIEKLEDYNVIEWHKEKLKQKTKPQVVAWSRSGDVPGSDIPLRYIGSELDMMRRTINKVDTPYFWIINDNCDYNNFDFDWRPSWSTQRQIHVWPTEDQDKGGDTMYVNTAEMKSQLLALESLENYSVINWHKEKLSQLVKPQIIAWSRNGNDVEGADITMRYIGTELEMMNRTLRKASTSHFWIINENCDYSNFNFDWRPSWSTQHQLHVWPTENQDKGGDTMYVNAAEMKSQAVGIEHLEDYNVINWHKTWVKEKNSPQIVAWSRSGADVNGADITLRSLGSQLEMVSRTLRKVDTPYFWIINENCDYTKFDFKWRPSWSTQNQLHVWPTEDQIMGGDTMYVNTAEMKSQLLNLENLENYEVINWHKKHISQLVKPQIIAWSRSGEDIPGADITLRYIGSELDMMNRTLRKVDTPYFWIISDTCDYSNFNFNWRPTWATETQLHVWPTENQTKGGDTMYVNTAEMKSQAIKLEHLEHYDVINWHSQCVTQSTKPQVIAWSRSSNAVEGADITIRYIGSELDMMNRTLRKVKTPGFWVISDTCDYTNFDLNWRPGWAKQSYLHVWPTENQNKGGDTMYVDTAYMTSQLIEIEDLEHYDVIDWHDDSIPQLVKPEVFVWDSTGNTDLFPDATVLRNVGDKFGMLEKTVRRASTPYIWILNSNNDYREFDFDWRPSWATQSHLHVWPSGTQTHGGDTMYVNVAEFKKQALEIELLEQYVPINWHSTVVEQTRKPDIIVWDGGDNTDYIKERFPDAQAMRNIGSRYDMMCRTMRHVESDTAWVINSKCDYSQFDFGWRPGWDTETQLHVWPTENQVKGGDTYYVDVREFKKQSLEITDLDQYNSVNWHKQNLRLQTTSDIVIWTFGGNDNNLDSIKKQYPNAKSLRYVGTHLEMVKKSAKYANTDYFWVLSDCCDYADFDANWRPDWETENSIHCWASGEQKFGDTFYVPKKQFLQEADDLNKLEYYSSVIWYEHGYSRLPWPVTQPDTDDMFNSVRSHTFSSIYEYFVAPGSTLGSTVDVSLWEKRSLVAYNKNGHVILCPRDCISQISTKLAEYPYIKYHTCENSTQKPQDIVFISYDEKEADLNYEILKKQQPAATRVHGVEGMVNALKAAAETSTTPWYYAVFAKTQVSEQFEFNFNPNYLDIPGNYIFHAYNTITDYTYGHGAVLMYHSKTVREATSWGFDFTTSFPYTYIPLMSCVVDSKTPWEAWRTSFREVLKLREMGTVESQYRMNRWLTVGKGDVGEWSILGAQDAISYTGSLEEANDWHWLRNYFTEQHPQHQ